MKNKLISWLIVLVLAPSTMLAQNSWTQKNNFGGGNRYGAFSFSIGDRGYVGTGINSDGVYKSDCWEYNPDTDSWTQIANYGGGIRAHSAGFALNGKGYVGTGVVGSYDWRKDFWEYDPGTNTWRQVSDFGGGFRYTAVGFSIGNKGYVGTGNYRESPFVLATYYNDFWEFDPSNGAMGTWTEKSSVPEEGRSSATGFSLNGKGYIGTGFYYYDTRKKDFWQYDPATNIWTSIPDFPGTERYAAVSFTVESKAYVGWGWFYTGLADFWEYDPTTGSWASVPNLPAPVRHLSNGFSIGNRAYVGLGADAEGVFADIWQFGYNPVPKLPSIQYDPVFVSNFAGSSVAGHKDAARAASLFNGPIDVATDRQGNIYVSDRINNRIRKISVTGNVITLAGNGIAGFADGEGLSAQFNSPFGIDVDDQGNVYVADNSNNKIRKITPSGYVSTVAGSGAYGFLDGPANTARFASPYDVAVDKSGNIFVTDHANHRIRKISTNGNVSTFAGNGNSNQIIDGIGTNAQFNFPEFMDFDTEGNLHLTESYGPMRKITPAALVSSIYIAASEFGSGGFQSGLVIDSNDNIYVSVVLDGDQNFIVKHTPRGIDKIIAGSTRGYQDGIGKNAKFFFTTGLALDKSGDIIVADPGNNRIRKISKPTLSLTTQQGTASLPDSFYVSANNLTGDLRIGSPYGFEHSLSVNGPYTSGDLYVPSVLGEVSLAKIYTRISSNNSSPLLSERLGLIADGAGLKFLPIKGTMFVPIVKFDPIEVKTLAGNGQAGYADGAPLLSSFNLPTGVASDRNGNYYIADLQNHRIRRITASGLVETFAGSGVNGYADGMGTNAMFSNPSAVAVDAEGNVYVSDGGNNRIRKISPDGNVTTLAGSGEIGFLDGPGNQAQFHRLEGIAVHPYDKTVYVADNFNYAIRKISSTGEVSTVAGNGIEAITDGVGINAQFLSPNNVALDARGNIYVTDYYSPLRKIDLSGLVSTLHTPGNEFDLFQTGVAIDNMFSKYLTVHLGNGNSAIYKLTRNSSGYRLAGSSIGYEDGIGTATKFFEPFGIAYDELNGTVIVTDRGNQRIRQLSKPTLEFNKTMESISVSQYFAVSGSGLNGDMQINAPFGYELALMESGPFSEQLNLSQNAGEVSSKVIFIRLKNGIPAGFYNGLIQASSNGAITKQLAVMGRVIDLIPPVVNCPATQEVCFNSNYQYNIPLLTANDISGIYSVGYSITGVTQRYGAGYDASGFFNPGQSIIQWIVMDSAGNISTCNTVVNVNPRLQVNIPNSYAAVLGRPNTIYIGYGFKFMLLTTQVNGGTLLAGAGYKYKWSTGSTNSYIIVNPSTPGTYTYSVTVTDAKGCQTTTQKTIRVIDVRCGANNNKVLVCEPNNRQRCINAFEVPFAVLFNNAEIGPCNSTLTQVPGAKKELAPVEENIELGIMPNPNNGTFTVKLNNLLVSELRVIDQSGKIILLKRINESAISQRIELNLGRVSPGVYYVQAIGSKGVYTSKMIVR